MSTLFISDLHLSAERPHITAIFLDFLRVRARSAEALYILGDLFEAWLGDDMVLPEYQESITALHELSDSGVPVYIMHGNRDFLMQEGFAQMCGCTLIEDPTTIDLYGIPTVLMHGDTLCTDDIAYQQFRGTVRNPGWQRELLAKTRQERLALARQFRNMSKSETSTKAEIIMDVNPNAVIDAFKTSNVARMIHGHTHRPAMHDLNLNGVTAQRIVLGDWYTTGGMLECSPEGCELVTFG